MQEIKLTRRQEEFINKMRELSKEKNQPIHYSTLAKRLGVSPFTAYDMLCLLEEKGLVNSEYILAKGKSGPGRAERVFIPIFNSEMAPKQAPEIKEKVDQLLAQGVSLSKIIPIIAEQVEPWRKKLAQDILARIPPHGEGNVRHCMEIMTIAAFRLRQVEIKDNFSDYFKEIFSDNETGMSANFCLLGGFVFGVLTQDRQTEEDWLNFYFQQLRVYMEKVLLLSEGEKTQLKEYLEVIYSPDDWRK
ncbi:MAG: hypothetical protein JEZ06_05345 [Anaerolineaceae bacterium]|nr:hypothetical protein [Anaerolineaceae bacterium]